MTDAANAQATLVRASWHEAVPGDEGHPVACLSNEAIAQATELAAAGWGTVTFTANRTAAEALGLIAEDGDMGDWRPITTAPRDGSRVRLGHRDEPSSMKVTTVFPVYGSWDGKAWDLNSFFTVPGGKFGRLSDQPTHWMPAP